MSGSASILCMKTYDLCVLKPNRQPLWNTKENIGIKELKTKKILREWKPLPGHLREFCWCHILRYFEVYLSYCQIWWRCLKARPSCDKWNNFCTAVWPWTLTLTYEKLTVAFDTDAECLCRFTKTWPLTF